jgi:diguanylate cyclase (GGDEF)-like protein/PAS domain S-box-containing protein
MFQLTLWSLAPLAAAALAGHTAWRLRQNEDVPGVYAAFWLCVCVTVWSGAQFLATLVTTLDAKLLFYKLQYPGVAFLPLAWFGFAITYARQKRGLTPRLLTLLSVIPVVTCVLAATSSYHELLWTHRSLTHHAGIVGAELGHGAWYWLFAAYGYSLIFAGTVILGFELSQHRRYRRALVAVMAAPVITAGLNLLYLSPWNPVPGIDPTPLGFAVGALLLKDGVLAFGLLDLVPVIRNQVVEQLNDGIIVVNKTSHIIDINPAAMECLGIHTDSPLNQKASSLIRHSSILDLLNGRSATTDIVVRGRAYDVRATPLAARGGETLERALVFRDITERREAELALKYVKADLEQQAHTDSLTGMHNRRFFMQRLKEETERLQRHGNAMSVLIFDLDRFKRVNDNNGHEVGDRVLQVISSVTQEIKRVTDVAARLGGEEFALLLPATDQDGAMHLAQRLRVTIAEQLIADAAGQPIRVTASIGVATITRAESEFDQILTHADRALYKAKHSGRNRVCFADD